MRLWSIGLVVQNLNGATVTALVVVLLLEPVYYIHSFVVAGHLVAIQDDRLVQSRSHRWHERRASFTTYLR